ncbi:MAG: hypothetical protein AB1750_12130 [Chloroflexota bacterium]
MFDGLRSDTSNDEPAEFFTEDQSSASAPRRGAKRPQAGKIFGMDARQRFVLSLLLLFAVCMLGVMCMFISGSFVLR